MELNDSNARCRPQPQRSSRSSSRASTPRRRRAAQPPPACTRTAHTAHTPHTAHTAHRTHRTHTITHLTRPHPASSPPSSSTTLPPPPTRGLCPSHLCVTATRGLARVRYSAHTDRGARPPATPTRLGARAAPARTRTQPATASSARGLSGDITIASGRPCDGQPLQGSVACPATPASAAPHPPLHRPRLPSPNLARLAFTTPLHPRLALHPPAPPQTLKKDPAGAIINPQTTGFASSRSSPPSSTRWTARRSPSSCPSSSAGCATHLRPGQEGRRTCAGNMCVPAAPTSPAQPT